MKTSRRRHLSATAGCFLLALVFLLATSGHADGVSARLFQDQPNSVIVEISMSRPSPNNLIVEVFLPRGVTVSAGQPKPAKIERKKGSVRWLLKDTGPGTVQVRLVANQAVPLPDCTAIIRYRQPGSGTLIEIIAQQ
jgi:uncharacterized protein (DUF58 family)